MTTLTPSVSFCCATVAALRKEHAVLNANGIAQSMRHLRHLRLVEVNLQGEKRTKAPIIGCDPKRRLAFLDAGSVDGGKPLAVPRTVIVARNDWEQIVASIV
ncbi:MAG: hypothetical protein Q8P78_01340 [bacterium]|nr:hypothetical protein [bacterium]